jgi:hypothetical protein
VTGSISHVSPSKRRVSRPVTPARTAANIPSFVLYQLRTSYLSSIKDGVGERLINVNSSVLNQVGFRAAGWAPNPADIKRTYSPPIPTAITSEYFQAPRSAGLKAPEGFGDDEEEGGMVTGGGSNDTVGPTLNAKRRRRKELLRRTTAVI